jgi:molecular chaperone Hsp33
VSQPRQTPEGETGFDRILAFTIPDRHARGRVVRLGPVADTILAAHNYPAPIRHLLAEALVLTALMGSMLKQLDGQLTMQAQTGAGVVELLVCDYRAGELRGYVRHDSERLAMLGANPSLYALFGEGFLAITFDLATSGERYQGVVPLDAPSLTEACQDYFERSEQLPTLLRTAVRCDASGCIAGGMLVQHLAEGEEGRERLHVRMDHPEWEHVSVMASSVRHDELVDPRLSLESLVWRLYHEEREVRIEAGSAMSRGCRCSPEHYQSVLAQFPETERAEMRGEDGKISVDCAFCSRVFAIDA